MHHAFSEMHHEKRKMHHALLRDAPRISHSIKIWVLSQASSYPFWVTACFIIRRGREPRVRSMRPQEGKHIVRSLTVLRRTDACERSESQSPLEHHNEEVSDFEQNYQNRGSFYFIYPRFTGFFLTVHFVACQRERSDRRGCFRTAAHESS